MTQRLSDLSGHAYGQVRFPTSISEIPAFIASVDPMTAGLILLAASAAFLVWAGSAGERAERARQRSGKAVTLPPAMDPTQSAHRK